MRAATKPTTYLTSSELQRIAAAKFQEAEALPNGPEKQKILNSAYSFRSLAEMKGWLSSELQPPKQWMQEYRAYVVGHDGHFLRFEGFVAADDEAALQHAKQSVDGYDVELWSGARFLQRLGKHDQ